MQNLTSNIEFTGEFFVPGKSGQRIEADHLERYKFARGYIKNCRVLDIACGVGYAGPLLIDAGADEYHGVDINAALIENANETYSTDKIKYSVGDICSLECAKRYDSIISFETIEHIANHKIALQNLYDLLEDGGALLISSPNRLVTSPYAESLDRQPLNPYHTQEFTIPELRAALLRTGFRVSTRDIYGQRNSLLYFRNSILMRIILRIFGDPSEFASPEVRRFRFKKPRYFVVIARKQPSGNS